MTVRSSSGRKSGPYRPDRISQSFSSHDVVAILLSSVVGKEEASTYRAWEVSRRSLRLCNVVALDPGKRPKSRIRDPKRKHNIRSWELKTRTKLISSEAGLRRPGSWCKLPLFSKLRDHGGLRVKEENLVFQTISSDLPNSVLFQVWALTMIKFWPHLTFIRFIRPHDRLSRRTAYKRAGRSR